MYKQLLLQAKRKSLEWFLRKMWKTKKKIFRAEDLNQKSLLWWRRNEISNLIFSDFRVWFTLDIQTTTCKRPSFLTELRKKKKFSEIILNSLECYSWRAQFNPKLMKNVATCRKKTDRYSFNEISRWCSKFKNTCYRSSLTITGQFSEIFQKHEKLLYFYLYNFHNLSSNCGSKRNTSLWKYKLPSKKTIELKKRY